MLPYHTTGYSHFTPSSSSSPLQNASPSLSGSSVFRPKVHSRYHPYAMDKRRCHYSNDSVSPSPPPTYPDNTPSHDSRFRTPLPTPRRPDYFSALPQELLEEIGLFASAVSTTHDDRHHEPFRPDRFRLHTLGTLCLVSKLFNQIFNHRLYTEPLVIDTQLAGSLNLPNSAPKWITSSYKKAPEAKRFTLWRPRSEEMSSGIHLRPADPVSITYMLTNICELTLSGNFRNTDRQECISKASSLGNTLLPKYVPHLTSVRLLDIDDAEGVAVLLVGIARKITSLVIQPSERGTTPGYSPRSVYNTLRSVIENLSSLSILDVSLPSVKFGLSRIDHCTHGCKLVHKSLVPLPAKDKLKQLSIDLPVFGCRTQFEKYDDDNKQVDHAWYYMTLQNFLADCPNLEHLAYKGSAIPAEIVQRLKDACPSAAMTFVKAEVAPPPRSTSVFPWMGPNRVVEPPAWEAPAGPTIFDPPPVWEAPDTAVWGPLTHPYPEPGVMDIQQFESEPYRNGTSSIYDFNHMVLPAVVQESTSNLLPPIYEYLVPEPTIYKPYYHDPSTWQTTSPSNDADDEEDEEPENPEEYYDEEQQDQNSEEYMYEEEEYLQEDATFNPHETMHLNPQSQEWGWFGRYPDQ